MAIGDQFPVPLPVQRLDSNLALVFLETRSHLQLLWGPAISQLISIQKVIITGDSKDCGRYCQEIGQRANTMYNAPLPGRVGNSTALGGLLGDLEVTRRHGPRSGRFPLLLVQLPSQSRGPTASSTFPGNSDFCLLENRMATILSSCWDICCSLMGDSCSSALLNTFVSACAHQMWLLTTSKGHFKKMIVVY